MTVTPVTKAVSTCTAKTEQCMLVFEIFDYSQHKGMGIGEFIRSGTFSVGGYDWAIRFYPDGDRENKSGCISYYLELLSKDTMVRASCVLRLVDQSTGLPTLIHKIGMKVFKSSDCSRLAGAQAVSQSTFEASSYLKDDHLTIQCITTVRKQPQVSGPESLNEIEVPPSDIAECLGKLLEAGEGADVTFSVGGETFAAHKIVLAMRSPVFKAELFGQMKEAKEQLVTIQDMQPDVFRALLHFIYTDSLPDMDDQDGEGYREMIRHLLVAADRYVVDRMKLVCASILCKNLDVETVSGTLALAYEHNCDRLKDVCLEFITSSSSVMESVVATQGYQNLKATCPSALVDAYEKSSKRFRKT